MCRPRCSTPPDRLAGGTGVSGKSSRRWDHRCLRSQTTRPAHLTGPSFLMVHGLHCLNPVFLPGRPLAWFKKLIVNLELSSKYGLKRLQFKNHLHFPSLAKLKKKVLPNLPS